MKRLLLIVFAIIPLLSVAKSQVELFSIEKEVQTESEKERLQILPISFSDVLVKLTGDRKIIDNQDFQAIITEKAQLALQRFSYYQKNGKKQIKFQFSKNEVKALLTKYHLTFWPAERPEVLVWLTYTGPEGNRWEFVSDENKVNYLDSMKRQAGWRGMPVNFPVLDLQDLQALNDSQAIFDQVETLKNLSKRYHADFVLAVSIAVDKTGEWRTHWQLLNESEKMQWEFSGKNVVDILTKGIDSVADTIVERYAQIPEDTHSAKQVVFSVSEISSVDDYLKVMHYLQSVKDVERVEVMSVNDDNVNFEIFLSSNKEEFKKVIEKESVLAYVEHPGLASPGVVYCRLGSNDIDKTTT